MIKNTFIIIIFVMSEFTFAQNNFPKIFFTISYNDQYVKMDKYNEYLGLIETDLLNIDEYLKRIDNINLTFSVQTNSYFDLGIYLGYNVGKLEFHPKFKQLNPDLSVSLIDGYKENRFESKNIGLLAGVNLSSFLELKHNFLKRTNFGLNLSVGYGFAKEMSEIQNPISSNGIRLSTKKTNGFQGRLSAFFEFKFTNQPFISMIGVNLGYQFYRTATLKGPDKIEWGNPEYYDLPGFINLDFSGFYYGVYLKLGK